MAFLLLALRGDVSENMITIIKKAFKIIAILLGALIIALLIFRFCFIESVQIAARDGGGYYLYNDCSGFIAKRYKANDKPPPFGTDSYKLWYFKHNKNAILNNIQSEIENELDLRKNEAPDIIKDYTVKIENGRLSVKVYVCEGMYPPDSWSKYDEKTWTEYMKMKSDAYCMISKGLFTVSEEFKTFTVEYV